MIGIVGEGDRPRDLAEALESAGLEAAVTAAADLDPAAGEVIVAVGESGLTDVVTAGVGRPVVPTELEPRTAAVAVAEVPEAINRFHDGELQLRTDPLLTATVDGQFIGPAYFDVLLVRSEPGRISEYSLRADDKRRRFRADGVVIATPAGSHGYAHAAGGPRLETDADAVAAVPVAAFGFGTAAWVLDPTDGIDVRVERDEGDVSLLLDGRERRRIAEPSTVTVRRDRTIEVVPPPE